MIDIKRIQKNLDESINILEKKGFSKEKGKELFHVLSIKKEISLNKETLQAKKNLLSKEIGFLMRDKDNNKEEIEIKRQEVDKINEQLNILIQKFNEIIKEIEIIHMRIPNFPHSDVPDGKTEKDNVMIEESDINIDYNQKKKPHWEIGEKLNLLDLEASRKLSGSMFAVFRGKGSKLLRALIQFALDINADKYEEIIVPHFITTESYTASGHLPKFADDAYKIENEELWAVSTAEAALMNLGRDKIYLKKELPKNFIAYSSSFRKEAGSYGKETRGLLRLHEFHKVELVKYVVKEEEEKALKNILEDSLRPIKLLKLPYKVIKLCIGDLPFSSHITYDIEVYSPGVRQWLEVSSISLCTDFQTRRGNIRYRDENNKLQFVSSLNASALATPRVFAAIIENYQQEDGTVIVPEVLQDYLKTEILK